MTTACAWFNVGIGVLVASNIYFNWRHAYWVRRYEKAYEAWHAEDALIDGSDGTCDRQVPADPPFVRTCRKSLPCSEHNDGEA